MDNDSLQFIFAREQIIKLIRDFFYQQGFHEVVTPILNISIPLEPNIFPFKTEKFYLPTSPEKNLKKMLALGMGNCFSIGHSFRNLEKSGPLHTPEFLMLEWYRENADYKNIMFDVEQLINHLFKKIKGAHFNVLKHYNNVTLVNLFKKYCFLELEDITLHDEKLFDYAKKKGYQTKNATWNQLYDQIFVNEIEGYLPKEPCFLIDFPSRISPLCKPKKNEPYLAERFELYIRGIELANGNTENTGVQSVKKLLRKPLDYEFLNSLKKMGNTLYAGVGLGVDRLVTILQNQAYIKFD